MHFTYGVERINVHDEHGNAIEIRQDIWTDVVNAIKEGATYPLVHIQPTHFGVEWEGVSPHSGIQLVLLRFTADEWARFCADCRADVHDDTLIDA